jgi:uncharacterized membrane protein YtjA (UPF0391 family)
MLRWALIFFVVALIAAVFGFLGIAAAAVGIARILFFIFLVLFLVSLVGGLLRRAWSKAESRLSARRGASMKTLPVVGLILIVLGIISFAYQGINYTTHKKIVDIGPIQASTTEHKTIPLPPIFGGLALVGGIVLLMAGRKE